MKETSFINQNKKKWAEFERMTKQKQKSDPDKMSQLFIEITDDLAYARTYYSKRSVRVYLNSLAQQVFHSIYKKKRTPLSVLVDFWVTGLPLEMYRSRKALLTAFLIMAVGMLIGIVSTIDDPDFLGAVIGYDYVDLTESNIKNGKPMDIYGSGQEMDSFLSIGINNLKVALITFVLGLFFSVGSGIFLFFNGIMVGAFQWFFKVRGLLLTSFLTIWIHGAFEIPAIILAGAAGITMGNGLMFPKTLTRLQSLSISAKRGVKIMIGVIPIIIIAAFIEGFATRHTIITNVGGAVETEWATWVKWLIILSSFSFMLLYFVVYPYFVAKRTNLDEAIEDTPIFVIPQKMVFYKIRNLGELFADSVLVFSRNAGENLKPFFVLVPLFTIATTFYYNSTFYGSAELDWYQNMEMMFSFDYEHFSLFYFLVLVLLLSFNITNAYHNVYNLSQASKKNRKRTVDFLINNYPKVLFVVVVLVGAFGYLPRSVSFLFIFVLPFVLTPLSVGVLENKRLFKRFTYGFDLSLKSWGNGVGLAVVFTALIGLLFLAAMNPIEWIIGMVLDWFLLPLADDYFLIKNIIWAVFYFAVFNFLINLIFTAFSLLYFSIKEQEEAISLKEQLETFGKKNKVYE